MAPETRTASNEHMRSSMLSGQATRLLSDPRVRSASHWLRARRWKLLISRFPQLAEMRVIDLGGLADAWLDVPLRPRELVLLNLPTVQQRMVRSDERLVGETRVRDVAGDACDPPEELAGERFDLVYCNSVIEHVGGHQRRVDLANAIHRLGEHHWVQTPYRFFPIEAHTLMPGLQFLPISMQAAAIRRWPIGHMTQYSRAWPQTDVSKGRVTPDIYGAPLRQIDPSYAVVGAQSIELLSKAEMRVYFPSSEMVSEKFLGLTKSLIAVG